MRKGAVNVEVTKRRKDFVMSYYACNFVTKDYEKKGFVKNGYATIVDYVRIEVEC